MDNAERGRRALGELAGLGVGLAIDDFGEGFSSLSRLRQLPVEQLKIDRSFMREVPQSSGGSAVIAAIVHLPEALGREVVAEGVETEGQRRFLIDQGCPLAQGFHLAPPLPVAEATRAALARVAAPRRSPSALTPGWVVFWVHLDPKSAPPHRVCANGRRPSPAIRRCRVFPRLIS